MYTLFIRGTKLTSVQLLNAAGLYRSGAMLKEGSQKLDLLRQEIDNGLATQNLKESVRALEAMNMIRVAQFVVMSALCREESRGAHQRLDFPETNDEAWLSHLEIRKKEGNIEIIKQLIKA
jgi:succinate dehydrogenase/fumarate reductase flavoprotein subunit